VPVPPTSSGGLSPRNDYSRRLRPRLTGVGRPENSPPSPKSLRPDLSLDQLVGATPEFRSSLAVAAKAARNRLPILIVGEPGTGKETFAKAIHAASLRSRAPLVALDCKACRRTSSTASCSVTNPAPSPAPSPPKTGKLVEANGGTLLLDDVTALPAERRKRSTGLWRPARSVRSAATAASRSTSASSPPRAGRFPMTSIRCSASGSGARSSPSRR
jgi:hypothetical protein